jgi:hypothetical protein
MSKWLVLPMILLAYIATSATAAAPRDRDHDRLPDRWERSHHLSTEIPSARRDPDGDHLKNRRELRLRTHPRRADTDGDRLRDGAEVRRFHTNPRKRDTDGDGLGDRREIRRLHTNPRRRDTDGDGFSDRVEVRAGTNPRNRRSHPRRKGSTSPAPPTNPAPPAAGGFPNRATTGVPAGWTPKQTRSTDLVVSTPGAVVEDVRFNDGASILIRANGVTIRRVEMNGGIIWHGNESPSCFSGPPAVVEDSTFNPPPGHTFGDGGASIGDSNMVIRRVEIFRRGEGIRLSDCDRPDRTDQLPVRVEDSFVYTDDGPWPMCPGPEWPPGNQDWHGNSLQGYYGRGATFVNNTFVHATLCGGSPYAVGWGPCGGPSACEPINKGNYTIDRMLVAGGGYTFRHQVPGSITGLRIVNDGWYYGPLGSGCGQIRNWEAKIVDIDVPVGPKKTFPPDADYRVTRVVRDQPCNTQEYN